MWRERLSKRLPPWLRGLTDKGAPYEPAEKRRYALYRSRIGSYMDRVILKTPRITLRLHRILREDRTACPHDHPFSFVSVILRGGYTEDLHGLRGVRRLVHGRGAVFYRRASDLHSIVSVKPRTLTFVVSGPKVQKWGFYTPTGWVYWRKYHDGKAPR